MNNKVKSFTQRVLHFFSPFSRLGESQYSYSFPLLLSLIFVLLSEFLVTILSAPEMVGIIAIFLFMALIVYLSFRDGIRGGFIAASITILYYLYILNREGGTNSEGIRTIVLFTIAYYAIAGVIGWLRQSIDQLIQKELDNRSRLSSVIQQLPIGVIITDKQGTVELVNKQTEKILGEEILIGSSIEQGLSFKSKHNGKYTQQTSQIFHDLKSSGKTIIDREFEVKRQDGKKVYVQVNADIIKNTKKQTIATATIINDITEKKELELRKDDFINTASHELKTPLTSLKLYADKLSIYNQDKRHTKTKLIEKGIQTQIERLQKLVSDLLDVSRLQTGKLSYNKEKFKIDALINETIKSMDEPKDDVRIDFKTKSSAIVTADKFRISQVLNNLLTNAIKFSPDNKSIIIKSQKADGKVIVSVQDHGIGIDESQHKYIFGRLYQVTDNNIKTYPGLGMGLYISKEIIERHKGKIWVESKKGKGSTFYFSLPLAKN